MFQENLGDGLYQDNILVGILIQTKFQQTSTYAFLDEIRNYLEPQEISPF